MIAIGFTLRKIITMYVLGGYREWDCLYMKKDKFILPIGHGYSYFIT